MSSQPEIYSKNIPSFTFSVVNCGFTKMKTFGERLKEKMGEVGIKAAELSRLSGVTKQNIGRLINNTPHSITGAFPKTEEETVLKLAKALNWDFNEALLAAGYAPKDAYIDIERIEIEAMYRKRKKLSPARKEAFKRILDMVDRELDRLYEEETAESESTSASN